MLGCDLNGWIAGDEIMLGTLESKCDLYESIELYDSDGSDDELPCTSARLFVHKLRLYTETAPAKQPTTPAKQPTAAAAADATAANKGEKPNKATATSTPETQAKRQGHKQARSATQPETTNATTNEQLRAARTLQLEPEPEPESRLKLEPELESEPKSQPRPQLELQPAGPPADTAAAENRTRMIHSLVAFRFGSTQPYWECAAAEVVEDRSMGAQLPETGRGTDDVEVCLPLLLYCVWARWSDDIACSLTLCLSLHLSLGLHATGRSWWLGGSLSAELASELLVDRDDKKDLSARSSQAWLQAVASACARGAAGTAQGAACDRAGARTAASATHEPRRCGRSQRGAYGRRRE